MKLNMVMTMRMELVLASEKNKKGIFFEKSSAKARRSGLQQVDSAPILPDFR